MLLIIRVVGFCRKGFFFNYFKFYWKKNIFFIFLKLFFFYKIKILLGFLIIKPIFNKKNPRE